MDYAKTSKVARAELDLDLELATLCSGPRPSRDRISPCRSVSAERFLSSPARTVGRLRPDNNTEKHKWFFPATQPQVARYDDSDALQPGYVTHLKYRDNVVSVKLSSGPASHTSLPAPEQLPGMACTDTEYRETQYRCWAMGVGKPYNTPRMRYTDKFYIQNMSTGIRITDKFYIQNISTGIRITDKFYIQNMSTGIRITDKFYIQNMSTGIRITDKFYIQNMSTVTAGNKADGCPPIVTGMSCSVADCRLERWLLSDCFSWEVKFSTHQPVHSCINPEHGFGVSFKVQ
ncbi:hypothetical protein RRG08_051690 [Elysia crispata]|uniref:Uncharacterized protein n=1 Tax=Elysia crispata TaxID=231223 RepID=A0AAE1AFY3_9GAST|nr:hypothetical protein RRG08_051690 [Elysia crispata]